MDRLSFLTELWKRFFKPLIFLLAFIFALSFFVSVFNEDGAARFSVLLVSFLALLVIAIRLMDYLFVGVLLQFPFDKFRKAQKNMPSAIKKVLKVLIQCFQFLLPFIYLAFIFLAFQKDWFLTCFMILIIQIDYVFEIRKRLDFKGK